MNQIKVNQLIAQASKSKNIEHYLDYLRSLNFHFMDSKPFHEAFKLSKNPLQWVPKPEHEKLQWMVRENSQGLCFDFVVSIKLWGYKKNKFYIYHQYSNNPVKIKLKWKDADDINFKKMTKKWAFPDYLTYDERRDWRALHRKVQRNPAYSAPEWYYKVLPDIIYL